MTRSSSIETLWLKNMRIAAFVLTIVFAVAGFARRLADQLAENAT